MYPSAPLTELLKKNAKWKWGEEEQRAFAELKSKIADMEVLGVPRPVGEIVLVTDSSNIGGGSTIFQWQSLVPEQIPEKFSTFGVAPDGTFKHEYPENLRLVPLGHWTWKWNATRRRNHSWEQELLAALLTFASQQRMVYKLPIVWFTDNDALVSFLGKEPPLNARLRRAYLFLSQFTLRSFHLPGLKNELCDYLSRNAFQELIEVDFENLAKEAFTRMDTQIDLWMHEILSLSQMVNISEVDYAQGDFSEIWQSVPPHQSSLLHGKFYYKSGSKLFCERKLVVPRAHLPEVLKMCHQTNNHPGSERTLLFFLKYFYSELSRTDLLLLCKNICDQCSICLLSKPNRASDLGENSSLPIPQLCNDVLNIDFVQMDPRNNFDYVLTVVDALSRFVQFYPCQKGITGEGVMK